MEIQNDKGIFKWFLIGACTLFLAVVLILPLIYVIYTALREGFDTYVASVTDTYAVKAILLTVKVVIIAVAVNSVFGLFAAWLITKFRFRGNAIELRVRVHGEQLVAFRQLGQELVEEGEKVGVFLHRIYLVNDNGECVKTAANAALTRAESVVI